MPDTYKAIAVDDEQHCLETLLWEIERNCPEVEIIGQYRDAEKAYQVLVDADIDILFLDINLQSTSGIELLNRLMPVDYHVIFVTAYDEYAIQAFDLAATHYLLKPVNGKKLKSAVERIKSAHAQRMDTEDMKRLISTIKTEMGNIRKIPFSVHSGVEFIDPDHVIYVEGENNYSILHLNSGKRLVVSKTLKNSEEIFRDYSFVRIHKSYLINLKYLKRFIKADGGYVVMENGKKLSVSRMRKDALNKIFK